MKKFFILFLGGAVMGGRGTGRERLRAGGARLTRQRAAVLAAIERSEGHLGVRDVLAAVRRTGHRIGLTTVYRTLELFARLQLIRKVHLSDGCQRYVSARAGHGHHLICFRCGRVVEFSGCRLGGFIERVAARAQFVIEDHWLELFGRCKRCRPGGSRVRRPGGSREKASPSATRFSGRVASAVDGFRSPLRPEEAGR